MKEHLKFAAIVFVLLSNGSFCVLAQEPLPDPIRFTSIMLEEKSKGDVDDTPYLAYLDSLGFKKSDTDLTLGKLKLGEIFYKKGYGKETMQVEVRNMKINKGKLLRNVKIKSTSDSILSRMAEQLKAFGMEEVEKNDIILGLAGNGIVAGLGDKTLIMRCQFAPSQSYRDRPIVSDDGKGWMDTADNSVFGHIRIGDTVFSDTLLSIEPGIDIYPKRLYSFKGKGGTSLYLFIYSIGHTSIYDEAVVYAVTKEGNVEHRYFVNKDEKNVKIGCKWWDQMMATSGAFPFEYDETPDEEIYGVHFHLSFRSLYVPVMESNGSDDSLRHTRRFDIYRFNGTDFVYAETKELPQ